MKELTKGDLVMTEHGLAWYQQKWQDNETEPYQVHTIDGKKDNDVSTFSVATRPQVEQYLKENGWEPNGNGTIVKTEQHYGIQDWGDEGWVIVMAKKPLRSKGFDTAPTQLAEAILMARLLNATKD